jgi:aspartokinase/homoserine dehydrogenase 1
VNLRLAGVADSRRILYDEAGLAAIDAATQLASVPPAAGALDDVIARLVSSRLERLVVLDATPSPDVARRHAELLRAGIAVVTPNKAATALDAAAWEAARAASRAGEAPYLYEATVGAGLGLVATLRDLVRTGDDVRRVEGVLSGTLSFVFNAMRDGANFSSAVREAVDRGFAEPDPRDDLSGRDVARKLAILAREMGVPAEAAGAQVESLVPPALAGAPLPEFMARLDEFDAAWDARLARAGQPLQYVARLEADGRIGAAVEAVAVDEPLAGLRGASLAVAFHTARYAPVPLVVQGPGASVDVTAAVLLADIVRACEAMR